MSGILNKGNLTVSSNQSTNKIWLGFGMVTAFVLIATAIWFSNSKNSSNTNITTAANKRLFYSTNNTLIPATKSVRAFKKISPNKAIGRKRHSYALKLSNNSSADFDMGKIMGADSEDNLTLFALKSPDSAKKDTNANTSFRSESIAPVDTTIIVNPILQPNKIEVIVRGAVPFQSQNP
ncbi:MAG: hypothetical protein H7Y07_11945 [Pyrinomonadaceae bacterium]|nr:hypothetical protein [Sphingobacteriaceae bacterium]